MATKPKAILSTHDGREASPITKASNVLFENGQTAQDILNDRQDAMISPVIENSSSMFKVGQGDNVDYSNNVVNGAYESMVLKGKSMVNCIQEPSSQDVVLPYEFEDGQYVTINDTKESGALGVELKGQTLVNLAPRKIIDYTASSDWDGYYHLVQNSKQSIDQWRALQDLKPNTKYYISCYVETFEDTKSYRLNNVNENTVFNEHMTVNGVGRYQWLLTTVSEFTDATFIALRCQNVTARGRIKIRDIMIVEYLEGMENWDIPYFEGMASCKMPTLRTVGKNLFNINGSLINGTSTQHTINDNSLTVTGYWWVRQPLNLKPNTTYTVTYGSVDSANDFKKMAIYCNETSKHIINTKTNTMTFETPTTFDDISVIFYCGEGGGSNTATYTNIQIEEDSSATTYEPYKSSILSLPEEVVLRSLPNGVCDTFNTRTGAYTQRIGEYVFQDTENATYFRSTTSNSKTETSAFRHDNVPTFLNMKTNSKLYCDIFPSIDGGMGNTANDFEYVKTETTNPYVWFNVKRSKLSSDTKEGFKEWLSQNPVRVQYQLETPIVTKINLSSTLKSWNTTTHIYSEIPENTLYPILSHSNPSYPVILKPSTKYSIVANSYSNNHTNSTVNFNLGGATASATVGNRVTTITTPSTLTSEELVMSGRGNKLNNVMVIEGDVVGDEPYFEGICDCQSPILSNVGKNLFDNVFTVGGWWDGVPDCNPDFMRSVNLTPVKPNTSYAYDSTVKGHRQSANFMAHDADGNFIKYLGFGRTFTTPSNCHYIHLYAENDNSLYAQIEEGAVSTTIEPYKSNILSCNGDKIELTGDMFEQGTLQWTNIANGTSFEEIKGEAPNRIRTKGLIVSKPNTTYRIINDEKQIYQYLILPFDKNGCKVEYTQNAWVTNSIVTTTNDTAYIGIAIKKSNDYAIAPTEFANINFEIREVDKTIVLRSLPNGVCDTLNVETGEYMQRIGECRLDGSEAWYPYRNEHHGVGKSTFQAYCTRDLPKTKNNEPINCDLLVQGDLAYNGNIDVTKYQTNYIHNYTDGTYTVNRMFVSVNKEMFGGNAQNNYDEAMIKFKSWVASNPITVQYELTTPIIKTVDLSGYPFSYENGHVQLSSGHSGQSLTPTVEYSVATNRNGQIRSNQKMVERHQKQLDQLQAIILANLVNSQYNQTLTTLKYELSRV